MYKYNKVDLKNFGARKIWVMSDKDNKERRNDFIEAWSSFDGFDFQFVDAIMAKDITLEQLKDEGRITDWYTDPNGLFSLPMFAVGLSHYKCWEEVWHSDHKDQHSEYHLILEDDARPTKFLCDSIFNGDYKKILKTIDTRALDMFYWGKQTDYIKVKSTYDKRLGVPAPNAGTAGHAYMITPSIAFQLMEDYRVMTEAIDFGIERKANSQVTLSPFRSMIQQQGTLLGKFVMKPDDPHFLYSSSTHKNYFIDKTEGFEHHSKTGRDLICSSVRKYVDKMTIEPNGWAKYHLKFNKIL